MKQRQNMWITKWTLLCFHLCLLLIKPSYQEKVYKIKINDKHPVCKVDDRFLSFSIGTFQARQRFKAVDFSSQKLKNLLNALRPAYLRLGGSDANFLIFRAGPRVIQPTVPSTTTQMSTTHQSTTVATTTRPSTTSTTTTTETPTTTMMPTTMTSTTTQSTTESTTQSTASYVITTPRSQNTIATTQAAPVTPAVTPPGSTPSQLQLPNINIGGTPSPYSSPSSDQSDSQDNQLEENDSKKDNEDSSTRSEYNENGKYYVEDLKDSTEAPETGDSSWKQSYNPTPDSGTADNSTSMETTQTNNIGYDTAEQYRYGNTVEVGDSSYSQNEGLSTNAVRNEGETDTVRSNSTQQEMGYQETAATTESQEKAVEDSAKTSDMSKSEHNDYDVYKNSDSADERSPTENNIQPSSTSQPTYSPSSQQSNNEDANMNNGNVNPVKRYSITKDRRRSYHQKFHFWLLANDFDRFANFVQEAGLQLIFDVNAFFRRPDGSWDAINAIDLLNHVKEKNYHVTWELGNEPNRYFRYGKQRTINPFQVAQDMIRFKSLLMRDKKYGKKLIGPGISKPGQWNSEKYLEDFLKSGSWAVDAVTWHQYYVSKTAEANDFINPDTLDIFKHQLREINKIVKKAKTNKPVWLGETGTASGGGASGKSDRFMASFMFLDKLGLASLYCNQVVIRQSLLGGSYALLDEDFTPRPDFWAAVLYKKLVGKKVFALTGGDKYVRIYAHCTNSKSGYPQGAITLIVINLMKKTKAKIKLEGSLKNQIMDQYLITPSNGKLTSKGVDLNGEELQLIPGLHIPKFRPVSAKKHMTLPPLSYGYFVLPLANFRQCM